MEREVADILNSIDATLKELLRLTLARQPKAPKLVASDAELDSRFGDQEVKVIPRDFADKRYKGRKMSECPLALLDQLASMYDYFADSAEKKNEMTAKGKPVADYKRRDAALARGWAKRIRDGKHAPAPLVDLAPSVDADAVDWGTEGGDHAPVQAPNEDDPGW